MQKNTIYLFTASLLCALVSCDGSLNFSSQSSSRSETNISENTEIVSNGDTTIRTHNRKEKTSSESENNTKIGFSTEDKTGITDEVRKRLKKENNDTTNNNSNNTKEKSATKKTKTALKGSVNCENPISADDFENAKAKVEKTMMDSDRVKKGKQVFNELCISSKQAQQLVSVLKMDNHKLELAKFLYNRTTDKDKYIRVTQEFTFDDNKKKLMNYIED